MVPSKQRNCCSFPFFRSQSQSQSASTQPKMAQISSLRALSDIIAGAVTDIEQAYAKSSANVPSLDKSFDPTDPAEAVAMDPAVGGATSLIIAAAAQLTASVRNPALTVMIGALSFHLSSCLRVASSLNVVEVLREAGPQGLHVKDIAKQVGTDADKLARVLRLLATHHIFREVATDIFANNRLSSVLDKGKSSKTLLENPGEKFTGTSGISALLEHSTDEGMKSSAYLPEMLADPKTAFLTDTSGAPFARAFATQEPIFAWFERPENAYRLARFAVGQEGTTKVEPPDAILRGFEWSSLPKDAVVVDVGGGIGSSSMVVAKAHPHLSIVNQDRAPVIEQSKNYWTEQYPEHVKAGKVTFQVHDFFTPQPLKTASVFLLRQIAHDWQDEPVIQILRHLRACATAATRLVLVEQVVPYAARSEVAETIPGAARPGPKSAYLLPNLGAASTTAYWGDLHMYTMLNGKERTMGGFVDVYEKAGWKITRVYHVPGSLFSHIVGEPI